MKILWISHDSKLGGAELCLVEATRALAGSGHELHCVLPTDGPLEAALARAGARVLVRPFSWWVHHAGAGKVALLRTRRFVRHLRSAFQLRKTMRAIKPDVVISNTLTIPSGAFAARLAGVPHVWYIHEFGSEDHGFLFDMGWCLTSHLIGALSRAVIANSRAVARKLGASGLADKTRVIYYAVDSPVAAHQAEAEIRPLQLVLVGRICPQKGTADAVRAVAALKRSGIETGLTLVGQEQDGYGDAVRALAGELDVSDRVRFTGSQGNPSQFFARADVALMCSVSEAFGRVTIEAMKMGLPVIGSDAGATKELINDGITGLLYRSGDPVSLAGRIAIFAKDRALMASMGMAAQRWAAETFSMQSYAAQLTALLNEVGMTDAANG